MKSRILKYCFVLGVVLTSCNKPDDGSDDLEYIWFDISGTVVDAAGVPIKGISVMAESAQEVQTSADGKFTVNGGGRPAETAVVVFADRDDDGKKYVSKSVTVDLVKYKDGHGWNKGYFKNRDELKVVMVEDAVITPPNFDSGTGQGE